MDVVDVLENIGKSLGQLSMAMEERLAAEKLMTDNLADLTVRLNAQSERIRVLESESLERRNA